MKKYETIYIGIFGVFGVLTKYLLLNYTQILVINIIAVILMALSSLMNKKYQPFIQTGYLGAFSSYSSIITVTTHQISYLLINVIICYLIYNLTKKVTKWIF